MKLFKRLAGLGILEFLLIAYIGIGAIGTLICLSIEGDTRFGAFVIFSQYAIPLIYGCVWTGLGELLFENWPTAIFWLALVIVINGLGIYTLLKWLIRLSR